MNTNDAKNGNRDTKKLPCNISVETTIRIDLYLKNVMNVNTYWCLNVMRYSSTKEVFLKISQNSKEIIRVILFFNIFFNKFASGMQLYYKRDSGTDTFL